jgi:hypothetical protein
MLLSLGTGMRQNSGLFLMPVTRSSCSRRGISPSPSRCRKSPGTGHRYRSAPSRPFRSPRHSDGRHAAISVVGLAVMTAGGGALAARPMEIGKHCAALLDIDTHKPGQPRCPSVKNAQLSSPNCPEQECCAGPLGLAPSTSVQNGPLRVSNGAVSMAPDRRLVCPQIFGPTLGRASPACRIWRFACQEAEREHRMQSALS